MHRGVEELAERIKEEDSGEDPRENLELGIMVLQMHQLVRDDGLNLIPLEEGYETTGDQDVPFLTANSHRDRVVRFDDSHPNARHALELSEKGHMLLEPRLIRAEVPRGEPADYGRVPKPPHEEGDDRGA